MLEALQNSWFCVHFYFLRSNEVVFQTLLFESRSQIKFLRKGDFPPDELFVRSAKLSSVNSHEE